jgi:hypothetical protein
MSIVFVSARVCSLFLIERKALRGSNLRRIELPPGGWVDDEFQDAGEYAEEQAYLINLKPARDVNGIRIVSKSYPFYRQERM